MKRVYQNITDSKYANCFQACVATYLSLKLEEVPNFLLFGKEYWQAIHWFFFSRGYDIGWVNGYPPDVEYWHIASIDWDKKEDMSHAVIISTGKIIHDPGSKEIDQSNYDNVKGYYSIYKRPKT